MISLHEASPTRTRYNIFSPQGHNDGENKPKILSATFNENGFLILGTIHATCVPSISLKRSTLQTNDKQSTERGCLKE